MKDWTDKRVRVKSGYVTEGRMGTAVGEPVFVEQLWVPVVWDDEEDPTFFKAAGLEKVKPDRERGLYHKYEVERVGDTEGKHDKCFFFVLDLDHDKYAIPALLTYSRACATEFPHLAEDLRSALAERGHQWL